MRALAIFVCFAGMWVAAQATTLQQLTLEEMAQKSTAIVRAKVTGSSGIRVGADVFTVYKFETLETVKGQNGAAPSEVSVPGGVAGGLRQAVPGTPVLQAGQEYVMFLWTGRSGITQLIGMTQGLFSVEKATTGEVLATRAAAGERMLDGAGHAVRDDALSMPWTELRAKVTKALAAAPAAGTLTAGRQ